MGGPQCPFRQELGIRQPTRVDPQLVGVPLQEYRGGAAGHRGFRNRQPVPALGKTAEAVQTVQLQARIVAGQLQQRLDGLQPLGRVGIVACQSCTGVASDAMARGRDGQIIEDLPGFVAAVADEGPVEGVQPVPKWASGKAMPSSRADSSWGAMAMPRGQSRDSGAGSCRPGPRRRPAWKVRG